TVYQDAAPAPRSADLAVAKTASPNPATVGSNLTYTITVTNNGPDAATGVSTSDALPAGVAYVSATSSQGTCSGASIVTCNLGSLANGASATVAIIVTPTQAGGVSNSATVSGNETDPNLANNTAAPAVTTINSPPPNLITVTQGGWGSTPSGNNPGAILAK